MYRSRKILQSLRGKTLKDSDERGIEILIKYIQQYKRVTGIKYEDQV